MDFRGAASQGFLLYKRVVLREAVLRSKVVGLCFNEQATCSSQDVPTTASRCYYETDSSRTSTLLSSSMAEHPAVNRRVVGSSPT